MLCCHPIYYGRQTACGRISRGHTGGRSNRRKVTQDFSSTFLPRCLPSFLSREGFSRSFPSSTVQVEFMCTHELIVLHLLDCTASYYSTVVCYGNARVAGPQDVITIFCWPSLQLVLTVVPLPASNMPRQGFRRHVEEYLHGVHHAPEGILPLPRLVLVVLLE